MLANERRERYFGKCKLEAQDELFRRWQLEWDSADTGRWTHRIIKDVRRWCERKHGQLSYHMMQVLTGHGSFGQYLQRFKIRTEDTCIICGVCDDTAEHAVFQCDYWYMQRRALSVYLEVEELTPDGLMNLLLRSKKDWDRITNFLVMVMVKRAELERIAEQQAGADRQ